MAENESEDEFKDSVPSFDWPQLSESEISDLTDAQGIRDAAKAVNLCLNNRFHEAESLLGRWADVSMYHSLGYATLMFLQAVMTFEEEAILRAKKFVKRAMRISDDRKKKFRFVESIAHTLKGKGLEDYNQEELHSELCFADCLLIRALLTFIQDENLISLIRGGLKVRKCYQSYKGCFSLLKSGRSAQATSDIEFKAGVHFGIGSFNLMISTLPSRVLKLLEFIGFSGNKKLGEEELLLGAATDSLRGPMCSLVFLGYNLLVVHLLGTGECDVSNSNRILDKCLEEYPNGAIFLFFGGRIRYIQGNVDEAIDWYSRSISAQTQWIQLHHICYWELMWCNCLKGNWLKAAELAQTLFDSSRWSKSTYLYQRAAFLAMLQPFGSDLDEPILELMRDVPKYKQRIAGKSIPIEKFAVYKSTMCLTQGKRLTLPGLEMVYIWNGFLTLAKSPGLLDLVLVELDKALKYCQTHESVLLNDLCLIQLLRGVSLRDLGQLDEAEKCLTHVFSKYKELKHDSYLAPYARMELGLLYIKREELEEAKSHLNAARTQYSNFLLESRLHFRVHSAFLQIGEKES